METTITPCHFNFDTTKGKATARFMLDYGAEHNTLWGCFLKKNGEFWWIKNKDIRLEPNYSLRDQDPYEKTDA